jgi:hypothetical protein
MCRGVGDFFCLCDKVHGTRSAASAKAQKDWHCAYKERTGFLQLESIWGNAKTMSLEKWYDMYIKPNHPELAEVAMRVLSQVI